MDGAWLVMPAALLGFLLWSPSEYVLHRVAMHSRAGHGPIAGEHRQHHRDPEATSAPLRTLLHVGVYTVALLAALGLAQILPVAAAVGLSGGYAAGFATYEILHWRSHHREPRWRYTIWLRRHHFSHHRRARTAFGVTSPVWDRLFRTTSRFVPDDGAVELNSPS